MLYFIPAWYQLNKWCETEQKWYSLRDRTEFDDTVKQVQLFHRGGFYPFQILLLSYAPNFRHFLHRQGVYHAPYWSCFDAIQEVRRRKIMTFSFHNLNWPPHVEFIYTMFVVVAMYKGEKYAQMEFGEDGNLIQIDMYQNGKLQRRNLYDDRGFVSATILFEEGKQLYQDYLTEKGVWKLREYADGHVEINPKYPHFLIQFPGQEESLVPFKHSSYACMGDVVEEVLKAYVGYTAEEDIFCAAMHELHAKILDRVLRNTRLIYSFYGERYPVRDSEETWKLVKHARYIITDTRETTYTLENALGRRLEDQTDITPFDSRVDFGISQQFTVQKILVPVDGLEDACFETLIEQLGNYLPQNDNAQIHLFTRLADYDIKRRLLDRTRQCLRKFGLEEDWARESDGQGVTENRLDDGEDIPVRFFVEQCVNELEVSKCMREQRLVIDMRETNELYLRIAGISVGIPQLVYKKSQFVEHGKNGLVIEDVSGLPDAMAYYLESLANWNDAMIHSYELGRNYSTEVLINKWKEVIDFVGTDKDFTTGYTGLE